VVGRPGHFQFQLRRPVHLPSLGPFASREICGKFAGEGVLQGEWQSLTPQHGPVLHPFPAAIAPMHTHNKETTIEAINAERRKRAAVTGRYLSSAVSSHQRPKGSPHSTAEAVFNAKNDTGTWLHRDNTHNPKIFNSVTRPIAYLPYKKLTNSNCFQT
jgi:hypothetical protein